MRHLIWLAALMLAGPAWGGKCHVLQFEALATDSSGQIVPVPGTRQLDDDVTFAASTQSAQFEQWATFVRIVCDAKAHFQFGPNPSADENNSYLPADFIEYFGVRGGVWEVAFYDGSS